MMLEDVIDEAHRGGLRVNNLFEAGVGTWLASVTDGQERYELAGGSTALEALRSALDGVIARSPVRMAGVPSQKSSVALSLVPVVEVAEARGADLAIDLAPVGVASGTATIASFVALTSAPTGVALGTPGARRSVTTAAVPALQIGGASALAAGAVAGSAPALAAGGAPSVAGATDFASIPTLMVGTNAITAFIFDDGTRWVDGTRWIDD